MAIMAVGSVVCALVPYLVVFILARVVQGAGGAAVIASSLGITIVAVIASRPGAGSPTEDLIHGWNTAVAVTAAFSILGGLIVLLCRPRSQKTVNSPYA